MRKRRPKLMATPNNSAIMSRNMKNECRRDGAASEKEVVSIDTLWTVLSKRIHVSTLRAMLRERY